MDHYDLVIVGGGPVAGTLTLLLASTRWKIALVAPVAQPNPPAASRALALNHSSRQILTEVNVWSSLVDQAAGIRRIEVSRQGEPGKTHLDGDDIDADYLGWVVPETELLTAIERQLSRHENLTRIDARPVAVNTHADHSALALDSGVTLSARLLIGADGVNSCLRELAGISYQQRDFHSTALCATIAVTQPHLGRAWERFTDQGPIALLPLANPSHYSLVWCVQQADANPLIACDDQDFLCPLQQQFGFSAGLFTQMQARAAHPLIQRICRQPYADRLLLVGSAARHLHPVGGQGLNLALRDLATLTNLLIETDLQRGDPGAPALLNRYGDLRRADWRTTTEFSGQVPGLFANHGLPQTLARNLALTALELIPPLRRAFIRRATGQIAPLAPNERPGASRQ